MADLTEHQAELAFAEWGAGLISTVEAIRPQDVDPAQPFMTRRRVFIDWITSDPNVLGHMLDIDDRFGVRAAGRTAVASVSLLQPQ